MTRTACLYSMVVVAATSIWSIPLSGAKPALEQSAVATFRCAATVPDGACPSDGAVPDGIRGDGVAYSAKLDSAGELSLSLTHGGGRTLWLDLRTGPTSSCPTCRRDFDTLFLDDVVFHTNVVDGSGSPVTGGMKSIPVGGANEARLKVAFNRLNSVGQTVLWAVRFNTVDYPGSDHVTVRRVSSNTWEVEAYAGDRALLASYISHRRGSDQLDGPFMMPFKVTVVSPAP